MGHLMNRVSLLDVLNIRVDVYEATVGIGLGKRKLSALIREMGLSPETARLEQSDDGKTCFLSDGKYPPFFASFKLPKRLPEYRASNPFKF